MLLLDPSSGYLIDISPCSGPVIIFHAPIADSIAYTLFV